MSVIEAPTVREVPSVSREVTTADVLNRAADLLEEFEWAQAPNVHPEKGTHCIATALSAALDSELIWSMDAHPAGHLVRELDFISVVSLWCWNDAPGRTKAEVVAKLREAARNAA